MPIWFIKRKKTEILEFTGSEEIKKDVKEKVVHKTPKQPNSDNKPSIVKAKSSANHDSHDITRLTKGESLTDSPTGSISPKSVSRLQDKQNKTDINNH